MPKRLNKKTAIIPLKKVEIQKEDGDEWIPPLDRYRTWVVKETFAFINLRFADTQQTQANGSDIEFRMHVVVMSVNKPNRITTKTFFSGIKTIYGGDEGLKLYLKTEIIKSIYAYEDSDYEIQSIAIQQLYIQNAKQYDKIKLGDIKMYNAVFDYTGYGLKAIKNEITNTCVPTYILNLFNNKDETNKDKKISKLNMDKLLIELNMTNIDDGCCISQIAEFCEIHRITYYALDYKYKTYATNTGKFLHNKLPKLVFMCANNHLYPITDESDRATIFNTSMLSIGGGMKKSMKSPFIELITNEPTPYNVETFQYTHNVLYEDMCIRGLIKQVCYEMDNDPNKRKLSEVQRKIIILQQGLCDAFFHDELENGIIHNSNIKLSSDNVITSFRYTNDNGDTIEIQENASYLDVSDTINTLNITETITNNAKSYVDEEGNIVVPCNTHEYNDKYFYTGQTIHRLAYDYYTKEYDKNITSYCSPQIYDMLKNNVNAPFLEFYSDKSNIAYDINKQYTNILKNCDKYGWCVYTPTDEIEPFNQHDEIETGRYYIDIPDVIYFDNGYVNVPLVYRGWFFDGVIEKMLEKKLITKDNIKYKSISSYTLQPNHFDNFVSNVYAKFNSPKQAINGFVGCLGQNNTKRTKVYFETDYNVVSNEFINSDNKVEIHGVYKHKSTTTHNILNMTDDELTTYISSSKDTETKPMIYRISEKQLISKYDNTLPIQRKIYDLAMFEMYELFLKVKAINPTCEITGIKTDCITFNNAPNPIETSDKWGGVKTCDIPNIEKYIIGQTRDLHTESFTLTNQSWNKIEYGKHTYINTNNITIDKKLSKYVGDGFLMLGMAGSGKSEVLKESQHILSKNNAIHNFISASPTHKACQIINGITIHRMFDINPIDFSYSFKKAHGVYKSGIKYILIDEVSMISEKIWHVLAQIKQQFNFIFIGFGDFKQLKNRNEEHIDFRNSWIVKYIFNNNLIELTKIHRFKDNELLKDAHACSNGKQIDFTTYNKEECDLCLCWTNDAVNALNTKWNTHYANNHTNTLLVKGFKESQFILHTGLKIMAYRSNGTKYHNSEEFIVKSFTESHMTITCFPYVENNIDIKIEIINSKHFKPAYAMTVHKSQGSSINRHYSIYEYQRMKHDMLYVALTRTREKQFVNFCDIEIYKAYTGYIYKYTYNNKSYIGSTNNIKQRKEQHKTNTTGKFGRAIKTYGYDNFEFTILEKIQYGEKHELYELENDYITKYNSIANGYNFRRNYVEQYD